MASIKDLKKRIGSVKNTQQTTKAMKMVSAAKLRRSQDAILFQRPYARGVEKILKTAMHQLPSDQKTSQFVRIESSNQKGGHLVFVIITSDRGLCGAFNASIIKSAHKWLSTHSSEYGSYQILCVGKKGHEFFRTRFADRVSFFGEFGPKVTFKKAKELSSKIIELFNQHKNCEVKVAYSEFKNAISQETVVEGFLPFEASLSSSTEKDVQPEFIIRPEPFAFVESMIEKNFQLQSFRMLLESQASEHGARMAAMENATRNAGEMIKKLTLAYNKQRQAAITKELLEIISGSESQKGTA